MDPCSGRCALPRHFLALLALCPASALAQPVFFDDFDGNALQPHWGQPNPLFWEYNVSNSMLNVTNLLYPSHPKSPTNFAGLGTSFSPLTDFQLDVRMGWGSAQGVARFALEIQAGGGSVAHIGYGESFGPIGVFAGTSAGVVTIPSPPPGIYDFRVVRTGEQYRFYFEGNLFASLTSLYTGPIDGVGFFFSSPYPGQSGPFHIDRVRVVPAPGVLLAPALVSIWAPRRRRKARFSI